MPKDDNVRARRGGRRRTSAFLFGADASPSRGRLTRAVVGTASVAVHVLVRAPVAVPVARLSVVIPGDAPRIATIVVVSAARVPPAAVIATPIVPPIVAGLSRSRRRGRGNRREPCRPRRSVCPGDPPGKGFQFRLTSPPLSHPRRVDISRTLRHCSPAQLYRIAATMTTIWRPHWLIKHIEPVEEEVPDDDVPDVKVEPVADDDGINGEDEKTHLEGKGAKRKRGPPTKGPCEHGVKYRSNCKVCSACPHGRRRSQCKECGGASICEHGRVRSVCKECGGSGICEHGRRRSSCKECGGSSICEHGRERCKCKECGGCINLRARSYRP